MKSSTDNHREIDAPFLTLFPASGYRSEALHTAYAVTPDDQHFIMVRPMASARQDLIVVENFAEELKTAVAK